MKKIVLLAVMVLFWVGSYCQLIKMPSRGKHHTYSHRGLFVGKKMHKGNRMDVYAPNQFGRYPSRKK